MNKRNHRRAAHFPTADIELFAQNQRSEHTARNGAYRLKAFAEWIEKTHGITELEDVTAAHLLDYKKTLAGQGLAASSQCRYLESLRAFFRWAHGEGLIPADPARNVKSPRPLLGKEPECITTDESRRLIASVDRRSPYAKRDVAILWALAYGLRVGEVAGLNCGDVIASANGRLPGLKVRGKGTRERMIPICPQAEKALRVYLAQREVSPASPVFVCAYAGERDRRMTTRAIQKRFAALCEQSGIDASKGHPHAARHGAATRWLFESKAPGGVYTVSRLLGHGSISTTEKYLHLNREALETAILSDPLSRAKMVESRRKQTAR